MLATYLVDRVTIPRNFMSRLVVGADSYVGEACAKRVRKEFIGDNITLSEFFNHNS